MSTSIIIENTRMKRNRKKQSSVSVLLQFVKSLYAVLRVLLIQITFEKFRILLLLASVVKLLKLTYFSFILNFLAFNFWKKRWLYPLYGKFLTRAIPVEQLFSISSECHEKKNYENSCISLSVINVFDLNLTELKTYCIYHLHLASIFKKDMDWYFQRFKSNNLAATQRRFRL